jgi:hypothetical protein
MQMYSLDDLRAKYGRREAFPSYLPVPTRDEFIRLTAKYGRSFPESFVAFKVNESSSTPIASSDCVGFGWANPNLEAYMSLEAIIQDAELANLPKWLSPFRIDEGNYYCFDTSNSAAHGDYPVVFWDHDENGILNAEHYKWPCFIAWLEAGLSKERNNES